MALPFDMGFALDMRCGARGIYIISRLRSKHIEFTIGKYIALRSNISTIPRKQMFPGDSFLFCAIGNAGKIPLGQDIFIGSVQLRHAGGNRLCAGIKLLQHIFQAVAAGVAKHPLPAFQDDIENAVYLLFTTLPIFPGRQVFSENIL